MNFDGDTVPYTSEKERNWSSPRRRIRIAPRAPFSPPSRPHAPKPGLVRSNSALAVTSAPSLTRRMRRVPSPPRILPGPPESSIRLYSTVCSG